MEHRARYNARSDADTRNDSTDVVVAKVGNDDGSMRRDASVNVLRAETASDGCPADDV